MTLKKYSEIIAALAKKNPNLKVIYSQDEEGNSFHPVCYDPTSGYFDGCDFTPDDGSKEFKKYTKVNSVCVN